MDMNKKIRMLLAATGLNKSELARRTDQSPQALNDKFNAQSWKVSELEKIAAALDCELRIEFISNETGNPLY